MYVADAKRLTASTGALGQSLEVAHAIGLALAAGPERWTAMEGGCPILVNGECVGGVGIAGGSWQHDQDLAKEAVEGWWPEVLADAIERSGKMTIAACYSRTAEKKIAFPQKYRCKAADSYEEMLRDKSIEAIVNTIAVPKGTPQAVVSALETAIRTSVASAEFQKGSENLGVRPAFLGADAFSALIAKEDAELSRLMQQIGLKKP